MNTPPECAPGAVATAYISETSRIGDGRRMSFRPGTDGWTALESFGAWCALHRVDPRRYIRARHEAMDWRQRVAVKALASAKFLERFLAFGDGRQAEAQSQERIADAVIVWDGSRRHRQPSPLAESIKRALLDNREACLADPMTLGFHPESQWCLVCEVSEECRRDRG